jgi:signal transduction histidine kinase
MPEPRSFRGAGEDVQMSLSEFIHSHHEEIIAEFAAFARTLAPEAASFSDADLRDHAMDILSAVVSDMGTVQSGAEQSRKSRGSGTAQAMEASGRLHADARIEQGFGLRSVLAEFRALRATVLRLYGEGGASDLMEVRRFNESVDEALTVSIDRFAAQTDLFRDQFLGVLSHDLRTPLGAVTAGAALLALPEDNPQRRMRVVTRIMKSAQRMERMIGDLLDLTRSRLGGSIPLSHRRTDLKELCEEVVLESSTARPDAVIRLDARGDLAGYWDPDRLAQVVSNLVGNAIQHGGGTPVTVTAAEAGDAVILTVHNGGAAIPPQLMRSIFEPLARGSGEAREGGSIGLGLFIAREIVSAHGGDIGVTSSSDHGTTVTARLPRMPVAGAIAATTASP